MLTTISVVILSGIVGLVYVLLQRKLVKQREEYVQMFFDATLILKGLTAEQRRIISFLDAWIPQADSLPLWDGHIHWWVKNSPNANPAHPWIPTTQCRCGATKKEEPQ